MKEIIEGDFISKDDEVAPIDYAGSIFTHDMHVLIFEEYIKNSFKNVYGNFFNVDLFYDSRNYTLILLIEREHISIKHKFELPNPDQFEKFQRDVDVFVNGLSNHWNKLISQQMIKRERIYTDARLIDIKFARTINLREYYLDKKQEMLGLTQEKD